MKLDEKRIEQIVSQVVKNLQSGAAPGAAAPQKPEPAAADVPSGIKGVFATVDETIEAAKVAQKQLIQLGMPKRKQIIAAMREAGVKNAKSLADLAYQETKIGRAADKVLKNRGAAQQSPGCEFLEVEAMSGDQGLTLTEYLPYGVICAIAPVTNPTSTVINNGIIMIAGGNSIVFCPHPSGKACTLTAMSLMNEAIEKAGGPTNLMTAVANPTIRSVQETMKHKGINLICATGGPAVVRVALEAGKKAICAGPGNPAVLVDETADLDRAARSIIKGASFDNNLLCIGEKEIIAVADIADDLLRLLKKHGAYLAEGNEVRRLTDLIVQKDGINKAMVGKDASVILAEIGVRVPEDTPIAVMEVEREHRLVHEEQLLPVVPLVRVRNFAQGLELTLEAEGGRGHTIVIHSRDINRITTVKQAAQCTVFVANGSSLASQGNEGEGYVAFTLAGLTGEGFTSPRTFVKQRRAAFSGILGVR